MEIPASMTDQSYPVNGVQAVSYTHLDVYKRQVTGSRGFTVDLYEEIIGFPESVLLHGRYHDILKTK